MHEEQKAAPNRTCALHTALMSLRAEQQTEDGGQGTMVEVAPNVVLVVYGAGHLRQQHNHPGRPLSNHAALGVCGARSPHIRRAEALPGCGGG